MANNTNLKPWTPGRSGNPQGKPKGTKHLSKWIQELLTDDSFTCMVHAGKGSVAYKGAPLRGILLAQVHLALAGDYRAFDLLMKYGYGTKIDLGSSEVQLPVPILLGSSKIQRTELS